jgi:hypothetical protein
MLRWQQPCADGVLRKMAHPCPNGCGQEWKHPAAEEGHVIEGPDQRPMRVRGQVDDTNDIGGDFVGRALEAWGFRKET